MTVLCHKCRSSLGDQSKFCPECGTAVEPSIALGQSPIETGSHRATVEAAIRADRRILIGGLVVVGLGVLTLVIIFGNIFGSGAKQPAPIVKGPDYNEGPTAGAQQARQDKAIAARAAKIVAHQQELQAAEAIERDKANLAAEQQRKDAAAVVYSPEQIAAAFRDNEVSAEQRFAAPFNVSGHVIDLETGFFSGSHMMLSYGVEVQCSFSEEDSKALANFHRGDAINVTGRNARRILGVVTMDCQLR